MEATPQLKRQVDIKIGQQDGLEREPGQIRKEAEAHAVSVKEAGKPGRTEVNRELNPRS